VNLDHERLPLHSDVRVINSKFISMLLLPFCSLLTILVRQWVKGKCALGPFLSILVIKCPTQMVMCSTMTNGGQSENQYKGMILDLVHWFLCTNIFV
jgi:hypothetical protein